MSTLVPIFWIILPRTVHYLNIFCPCIYSFQKNSKTVSRSKIMFIKPDSLSDIQAWRKLISKNFWKKIKTNFQELNFDSYLSSSSYRFSIEFARNFIFLVFFVRVFWLLKHNGKDSIPYLHILISYHPKCSHFCRSFYLILMCLLAVFVPYFEYNF